MDFEVMLPFQVVLLMMWPFPAVTTTTRVLLVSLGFWVATQAAILIRAIDQEKGWRLKYFIINEIYASASIILITVAEGATHGAFRRH